VSVEKMQATTNSPVDYRIDALTSTLTVD